jgi:hypothetical protein
MQSWKRLALALVVPLALLGQTDEWVGVITTTSCLQSSPANRPNCVTQALSKKGESVFLITTESQTFELMGFANIPKHLGRVRIQGRVENRVILVSSVWDVKELRGAAAVISRPPQRGTGRFTEMPGREAGANNAGTFVTRMCPLRLLGGRGPLAYAPRDKGRYCDGTVTETNGSRQLELRSLTFVRSALNFSTSLDLRIAWRPLPRTVRIIVLAANPQIKYRLDTSTEGGAGSFLWEAENAWQIGIKSYKEMNVLASYEDGGRTIYLPCGVGSQMDSDLTADLYYPGKVRTVTVYARGCNLPKDCEGPDPGAQVAREHVGRGGAFSISVPSASSTAFYALRFEATTEVGLSTTQTVLIRAPTRPTK